VVQCYNISYKSCLISSLAFSEKLRYIILIRVNPLPFQVDKYRVGDFNMNERSSQTFWGMVALSLSLVVAALIISSAAVKVKRAQDAIAVTGSARMQVESDFAVWLGSITANAPTLQRASLDLANYRVRVNEFFKRSGIPDSVITFKTVYSIAHQQYDENGRFTGHILGYEVSQWFEIRSANIDMIISVADAAQTLMREGIPFSSNSPEFFYTQLDEARVSLMAEATKDARRRAEQIAKAARGSIGPIRQARMGVIQVVAPHSTTVSDYGVYDTSTRKKDVVAVVKVTFSVK
jgi:hypothetical protein